MQEKPEQRVTPVSTYTAPELASSSAAAADIEMQLQATDKRAVGTLDDSETEDGHKESKRARTIVEWRCACWMTITTTGSMNLDRCWKIRRTVKRVVWIAETCLNTSSECRSVHLRRKDSSPKKHDYATRNLKKRCVTMP